MQPNNTPSSQGLALGSTSLQQAIRFRPKTLVDGKAKPCHDGGESGRTAAMSSRTREVRAFLFQLQPALLGRVQLVALAGEQGAGLRGLGGVALVERGVG